MQTILRVLVKINRENFSLLKKQEKLIKKVKNKNKGLNKNTNLRHRKIKQIQKLNTKKKLLVSHYMNLYLQNSSKEKIIKLQTVINFQLMMQIKVNKINNKSNNKLIKECFKLKIILIIHIPTPTLTSSQTTTITKIPTKIYTDEKTTTSNQT